MSHCPTVAQSESQRIARMRHPASTSQADAELRGGIGGPIANLVKWLRLGVTLPRLRAVLRGLLLSHPRTRGAGRARAAALQVHRNTVSRGKAVEAENLALWEAAQSGQPYTLLGVISNAFRRRRIPYHRALRIFDVDLAQAAVRACGNNLSAAAALLGIHRNTLAYILKRGVQG